MSHTKTAKWSKSARTVKWANPGKYPLLLLSIVLLLGINFTIGSEVPRLALGLGIITAVLGYVHFSLDGMGKAAGEWTLVCIGYNLKRLFSLKWA